MLKIKRFISSVLAGLLLLGGISFGSEKTQAAIEVDPLLLAAPTGLKVERASWNAVKITWNPVDDERVDHYNVYRDTVLIGQPEGTEFSTGSIMPGEELSFKVEAATAVNVKGDSSNIVFVMPRILPSITGYKVEQLDFTTAKVSWNPVVGDDVDHYNVYIDDDMEELVAQTEETEYILTDLIPDGSQLLGITIKAVSTDGFEGRDSSTAYLVPIAELAPPQNLRAEDVTETGFTMKWDAVEGAEFYYIFELNSLNDWTVYGTEQVFSGLRPGSEHRYYIFAENDTWNVVSEFVDDSLTVTTSGEPVPWEGPTGLTVTEATYDSVSLVWDADINADSYRVYRDGVHIADPVDPAFMDKHLEDNTTYHYAVRKENHIYDEIEFSDYSYVDAKTLRDEFKFRASRVAANYVALQWSKIANATNYEVVRDEDVIVYSGSLTTFTDNTVSPNTHYTYTVQAVNDVSVATSQDIHLRTLKETPPHTVIVTPDKQTETTVTFTFKLIDGANVYYVERNPRMTFTKRADGNFDTNYYNTVTGEERDLGVTVPNADGTITFKEDGLTAGTAYHYDVTAVKVGTDGYGEVVGETPVDTETAPVDEGSTDPGDGGGTDPGDDGDGGDGGGSGGGTTPEDGGSIEPGNGGSGETGNGNNGGNENRGFSDLSGHWAENEINHLANLGIVNGEKGKFFPNRKVTRAEFTAMVVRAFGDIDEESKVAFDDVTYDKWYYDAVNTGADLGFVEGVGQMKFDPNATVTRQVMATILGRIGLTIGLAATEEESAEALKKFEDSEGIADWAALYVGLLVLNKVITGVTDETFVPKKEGTRAESAVLIYRMLEKLK